ncbi:MAG: vitamin K epoxide reductase family protein [Candidatus Gracilibacteria bacterium]|nr:vitamin K epoxide reductase family protein [Candidatus Gracilibacteria bacterium]MDD2909046.1 vitamin K epoxide reductase family protein [Candidatus Gracilibacteria bacterium]
MKKLLTICILSVIAFMNATYLTVQNYKIEHSPVGSVSSFCDLSNSLSCTNVLSSPYSKVLGLPFTAVAMIVYPIIFAIAFLGMQKIIRKPFHILSILGVGGIMFNGYFISQEFLNIGSYCPLCMVCTGIIIVILILGILGIRSDFNKILKK